MMLRRVSLAAALTVVAVTCFSRPVVLAEPPGPQANPPAAASAPRPPAPKAADLAFERLDVTVRFETDGTGEYQTAARIRALTDAGVQQLTQIPYYYDASLGTARFEHLEVRKPSGQVSRAAADAITDTAIQVLPNVMSGIHQLQAPVPGLATGDVVDYRVIVKIEHPQIPGQFWWQHRFTTAAPVTTETLTIDVPSARAVRIKTARGCEASPPDGETRDGRRIYRWTRSNPEPASSADSLEKSREGRLAPPDILMTTFRSWDELGRWYLDAARDREAPDRAIVAKAEELTRGLTNPADKLRALYEFVAAECRYLSLSFGMGALVPHRASDVLANRYGDCKDRHTLLAALARAVGIRTYPALISSTQLLEPDLPSPVQTDHMITVGALGPDESDWVWLDSSSGVAPFGLILPALRNKTAVVFVADAAAQAGRAERAVSRLVTTPAAPPFPCFHRTRVDARLSPVGTLDARATIEIRGDEEVPVRAILRLFSADQRADFLKTVARELDLTGELTDPQFPDPAATRDPLRIGFRVRQENWFDRAKGKTIDVPLDSMTLPDSDEKDWQDKASVKPWSLSEVTTVSATIDLPAGFVPTLPVDVTITRDYAQYRSTHTIEGSRLTVERVLSSKAVELPAGRMRDYLAFVAAVRSDERQTISLDTTKAAPVTEAADATPTELYRLGLSQTGAGDIAAAVATLKRVVELAPKDPDAWDALGLAYAKQYQWSEAERAFREQVKVEPFHKSAWSNMGWALQQQGKLSEAAAAYRKQIEIVPLHSGAVRSLGELLLVPPADYKEAAAVLGRAVQIAPDDAEAAVRLGEAWLGLGERAKAVAEFERARTLSPGAGLVSEMAYDLVDAGAEIERGVEYAKWALRQAEADSLKFALDSVTPNDVQRSWALSWSWHALGWAAYKEGDYAAAERYLSAARSVRGDAVISNHLSLAVGKLGRKTDAIRLAAESLLYAQARAVDGRPVQLPASGVVVPGQALEPARAQILLERSAQFTRPSPKAGTLRFIAIFTNGSPHPEVKAWTHDPDLEPLLDEVRTASFPVVFPDAAPARVVSDGSLVCGERGQGCFAVLFYGSRLPEPPPIPKR